MGDAAKDNSSPCPRVFSSFDLSVSPWLDFQVVVSKLTADG